MSKTFKVKVYELEDKINRICEADESINLEFLCECILQSLHASRTFMYHCEGKDGEYYYPAALAEEEESSLANYTLENMPTDDFTILYDDFEIDVDSFQKGSDSIDSPFKVISGNGYGFQENLSSWELRKLFYYNKELSKKEEVYLQKTFDLEEVNQTIEQYQDYRKELIKPKTYIFNVSLDGFRKEIQRKIAVNNNISIDAFCRIVVASMNGEFDHLYGVRQKKEYLEEGFYTLELYCLELQEKSKIRVIYDFGDSWCFYVTLSKIVDGYQDKNWKLLSGKGYGIVEDCGGIWGLDDVFNGTSEYFEKEDINEFNLEECNNQIKMYVKE